jgi:non-specific protein-tyrosine kinase
MADQQLDLYEYLRPLLRWWWLLLAATFVAATASFIYTVSQPDLFVSRATILIGSSLADPNPSGSEVMITQQLADTYADIARRAPIREATMDALGLTSLPYYRIDPVLNRPVIQVYVEDKNPEQAFLVAQELVRQIILLGPQGQEEQDRDQFVSEQLANMQFSIGQTEQEIVRQQEQLLTLNSARELTDKQTQIVALETKLTTLRQNYADLLATTQGGAVNALSVLEPAYLPLRPLDSGLLSQMVVAAALGLFLAAAAAYLLEFLDNTLRESDEVKKRLGVTLLGAVPEIPPDTNNGDTKLILLQISSTPIVEAYRVIRTNLQFASVDHSVQLLLVSSPVPQDGKSLTAANLAIVLARAGKRVVLVDADLHRPAQHRLFKLYNNMGLTTALLNVEVDLSQLLQPTLVPGLSVLTSGPLPPNPAEMLGSQRMQEILARLKEQVDTVIIDSPPLAAVVDGIILAAQTDGMLLVLRTGKTRLDTTRRALAALATARTRILGVVLNGVNAKAMNPEYHYYGYYNAAYNHAMSANNRQNPKPGPVAKNPIQERSKAGTAPSTPQNISTHRSELPGDFAEEPSRMTSNGLVKADMSTRRRRGLPWG